MKLVLEIIGRNPQSLQDKTLVRVDAEGDVGQIAAQLRAVADSLIPPAHWPANSASAPLTDSSYKDPNLNPNLNPNP